MATLSETRQNARNSTGDDLAVIAQRAQAFTNASGSAIALSEGNTDEIVCKARSGSSAPDVGATLRVDGTFTGVCIQSGKELRCDDAETDTRVDTAAIRALGIRSMVVTPIKEGTKTVGVLAVFAPNAHAFTITHVAVLKTMADQISALLHRRAKEESSDSGTFATMPKPVVSVASPISPAAVKPALAPLRAVPVAKVEPIRVEPVKLTSLAEEIDEPIAPPRVERRPQRAAARNEFATLDPVHAKQGSGSKPLVIGVVALLLVAGSVYGFMKWRQPAPAAAAAVAPSIPAPSTASPAPAASVPSAPQVTPATTSAVSEPEAESPAPVASHSAPAETRSEKPVNHRQEKSERASAEKTAAHVKTSEPETAKESETVSLSGGHSRISAKEAGDQSGEVAPAPALSVAGSQSPDLSNLTHATVTEVSTVAPKSNLVPARPIRQTPPVYPSLARSLGAGSVDVKFTIGKDGRVKNPQAVSGAALFRDAAIRAVSQWQYHPATLNGAPIEQEMEVKVSFPRPN